MEDLSQDLSNKKSIEKQCLKTYRQVILGYEDQRDRVNNTLDFWDIYDLKLNQNQAYENSLSKIYVPIVHDAIEARVTRFVNQIFPTNGRFVEVVSENGDYPYGHMALLENYIRKAKLRTQVLPALCRNGDIEGQYTVYVSWKHEDRTIRYRKKEGVQLDGIENTEIEGIDDIENIVEEELEEGYPHVEVISDCDLLVLPQTSDSIEDALEAGGSVSIAMRLTKGKLEQMIEEGILDKEKCSQLLKDMGANSPSQGTYGRQSTKEVLNAAAGVKITGNVKTALIYQTWSKLKIGKERRLCVMYFGGDNLVLSAKLNPYWCDKCPIISVPIKKVSGVFKGISQVQNCAPLQYAANDYANLGLTSGIFGMQPIVMTDPEKNPRTDTMMMNVAAIWKTSPNDTQFAVFPQMWKEGFDVIEWCKAAVFQALGVNPAMITQGSAYRKPTQAEMATEQQVDVITTADAVTTLEEGILTPIIERFYEYDRQFRDEATTVRAYGQMGQRVKMEVIEPIQDNNRYMFRWFGVEQARSAQRIQQQIAAINVIRGIPPQLMPGRRLDMVPFVESLAENAFGPRLAPLIFTDERDKLSVDPMTENMMLHNGFEVHTHPMDNDLEHIQAHTAELANDTTGFTRIHIMAHQAQLLAKQQQAGMMGPMQGDPASPAGAGASLPQAGVSPAGPSNIKTPGMIHVDQLNDPSNMPRKF